METTYSDDVMLLRWGDSAAGQTVTFQLDPDGPPVNPFRDWPCGKENGQRFRMVAVPKGDDEEPVMPEKPAPLSKTPQKFHDMPLVKQAGIKCADPAFQAWVGLRDADGYYSPLTGEDLAAAYVRGYCGVTSRAKLDTNEKAAGHWRSLLFQYERRDDPNSLRAAAEYEGAA